MMPKRLKEKVRRRVRAEKPRRFEGFDEKVEDCRQLLKCVSCGKPEMYHGQSHR